MQRRARSASRTMRRAASPAAVETLACDQRREALRCRLRQLRAHLPLATRSRRTRPAPRDAPGRSPSTRRARRAARRATARRASTKPARMPARPKNLPTERSTTSPSRSAVRCERTPRRRRHRRRLHRRSACRRARASCSCQCSRTSRADALGRRIVRIHDDHMIESPRATSRATHRASSTRCPARSNAGAYSPYVSGATPTTPRVQQRRQCANRRLAARDGQRCASARRSNARRSAAKPSPSSGRRRHASGGTGGTG